MSVGAGAGSGLRKRIASTATAVAGGVTAIFEQTPEVAKPAAFIAGVLALVGLTTETLGVATRTASIWISVLIALLTALLLLGTVVRANTGRATLVRRPRPRSLSSWC